MERLSCLSISRGVFKRDKQSHPFRKLTMTSYSTIFECRLSIVSSTSAGIMGVVRGVLNFPAISCHKKAVHRFTGYEMYGGVATTA